MFGLRIYFFSYLHGQSIEYEEDFFMVYTGPAHR